MPTLESVVKEILALWEENEARVKANAELAARLSAHVQITHNKEAAAIMARLEGLDGNLMSVWGAIKDAAQAHAALADRIDNLECRLRLQMERSDALAERVADDHVQQHTELGDEIKDLYDKVEALEALQVTVSTNG